MSQCHYHCFEYTCKLAAKKGNTYPKEFFDLRYLYQSITAVPYFMGAIPSYWWKSISYTYQELCSRFFLLYSFSLFRTLFVANPSRIPAIVQTDESFEKNTEFDESPSHSIILCPLVHPSYMYSVFFNYVCRWRNLWLEVEDCPMLWNPYES